MPRFKKSSTKYLVLKALIPYSRENLKLSFHPAAFFADLERQKKISKNSARNSFNRAIEKGLVEMDDMNIPRLTDEGIRSLAPFTSKKLKGAKLLAIFDISEAERWRRDHLRITLREFSFKQIQKSVWATDLDCFDYIKAEIINLHLENQVKLFEAREIY